MLVVLRENCVGQAARLTDIRLILQHILGQADLRTNELLRKGQSSQSVAYFRFSVTTCHAHFIAFDLPVAVLCTCKVILRRVRATNVAAEKQ
jgi:hypothetical protein